jgi:hypothetical protein
MIFTPQKNYIGPCLSVSLVVVPCVPLVSVELGTGEEKSYTKFGSKIETYSCPTWVRTCMRDIIATRVRRAR